MKLAKIINPFGLETPQLPPETTGPFHPEAMTRSVAGPFGPGVKPGDPVMPEKPLLESLGVTPDAVKALLVQHPDAAAAFSGPEAEALRGYLGGNKTYDMHVLNGLVAELADGLRTRRAMQAQAQQMPAPRPMRYDRGVSRWALEAGDQSVAPNATRGPIPDVGYTEIGEASNPAPSEWWLEGK